MIKKEKYPVDFILNHVTEVNKNKKIVLDGDVVRIGSKTLNMYKKKGTRCIKCGLPGLFFRKQKEDSDKMFHLTLYAVNDKGREVMMTKDHITPLSEGKDDSLENIQPFCEICNQKKGGNLSWMTLEVRIKKYGKKGIQLPNKEERKNETLQEKLLTRMIIENKRQKKLEKVQREKRLIYSLGELQNKFSINRI